MRMMLLVALSLSLLTTSGCVFDDGPLDCSTIEDPVAPLPACRTDADCDPYDDDEGNARCIEVDATCNNFCAFYDFDADRCWDYYRWAASVPEEGIVAGDCIDDLAGELE